MPFYFSKKLILLNLLHYAYCTNLFHPAQAATLLPFQSHVAVRIDVEFALLAHFHFQRVYNSRKCRAYFVEHARNYVRSHFVYTLCKPKNWQVHWKPSKIQQFGSDELKILCLRSLQYLISFSFTCFPAQSRLSIFFSSKKLITFTFSFTRLS